MPYLARIDETSLLVSVETPPLWMRWRTDGGGAGAEIVARGRELIQGPDADASVVVTRPESGGPMQQWDIGRDAPVGETADRIVLLGAGIAARSDGAGGMQLQRIDSGEPVPFHIPGLPDAFDVLPGGWERPAFVLWDAGIVAFDPTTGRPLGAPLDLPSGARAWSASETRDEKRAVISFEAGGRLETAVFDLETGSLLARGLHDLESSRVVDAEHLVGISESRAQLYDIATLEPVAALPRAVGGGQRTSVSIDGRTLLNVGWNNALTLYDLPGAIALGAPLRSDLTSFEFDGDTIVGFRVGGFLTADGETLLEGVRGGIRVWDLRPGAQASRACALAGRELTEEEWTTYFPDETPVATCAELRR